MLTGTVCGLLLLRGVWPWLWSWTPFPALPCWLWGQSHCLCPCLPHTEHSLVSYRRLRSGFTPAALAFSHVSCSPAARPCGLVPAAAIDLESRGFAVCRHSASLASITAWSRCCLAIMLNNASGSCVTRSKRLFLSTLRRNSSGSIPAAIASTSTLPCFSVYCRTSGLTTSVSPLSARYFRKARFCIITLLSTGTLASIFSTRNIWRQKSSSLVCCISTSANHSSP